MHGYYSGGQRVAQRFVDAIKLVLANPSLVLKQIGPNGPAGVDIDYGAVLSCLGFDGSARRGVLPEYIRHSGLFSPDDIARAETASKTEWPWV